MQGMRYTYYGRVTNKIPKIKVVQLMLEEFNLQKIDENLRRNHTIVEDLVKSKKHILAEIVGIKDALKQLNVQLTELSKHSKLIPVSKKTQKKDEEKETIKQNLKKKGFKVD